MYMSVDQSWTDISPLDIDGLHPLFKGYTITWSDLGELAINNLDSLQTTEEGSRSRIDDIAVGQVYRGRCIQEPRFDLELRKALFISLAILNPRTVHLEPCVDSGKASQDLS
jgi:hypothetical protein